MDFYDAKVNNVDFEEIDSYTEKKNEKNKKPRSNSNIVA